MAAVTDGTTDAQPSVVSHMTIHRNRTGSLEVTGRSWQDDGTLSSRFRSKASSESMEPASIFFFFYSGERPRYPDAPEYEGTGEIVLESADRASGHWTTRSPGGERLQAKTSCIFRPADPVDRAVPDGNDPDARSADRAAPGGMEGRRKLPEDHAARLQAGGTAAR